MDNSNIYIWTAAHLFDWGVPLLDIKPLATGCLLAAIMLIAWASYAILTHIIDRLISRAITHTRIVWDDILLGTSVRRQLWRWITAFIICTLIPQALTAYPVVAQWSRPVLNVIIITLSAIVISAIINAAFEVMAYRSVSSRDDDDNTFDHDPALLEAEAPAHSLGGVRQMLQLILALFTAILIFSTISGKNIIIILSGLGASAAVLMLVFKDSILGLVAGIQLTVNDMLRPGDWIAMSKYDVNGRVRKVNLTTVKVQNYDNTIITIPPYVLVSETFQNWRGMERSGGRRIMRAIPIDMSSIRLLADNETARWHSEPWWSQVTVDADGRCVNLSLFRAFLLHYIASIPSAVPGMLMMVRELAPTPTGLPLEIYFFTSQTQWAAYETVQADVIDRVIASVPDFGLRIFQSPSGHDINRLH